MEDLTELFRVIVGVKHWEALRTVAMSIQPNPGGYNEL